MYRLAQSLALMALSVAAACSRDDAGRDRTQAERNQEARKYEPDNTGRNVRDAGGETKTPLDQSNNSKDTKITQEIRQAITSDKSMSVKAQNVRIITNDGVVTLRGAVEDNDERTTIADKARSVDGVARVDNQLETVR